MLDELAIARADGRFARMLATWARTDVLVIDDFLLRPLSADQAADTLEVIEDRAGLRSTVFTSQLPVAMWHDGHRGADSCRRIDGPCSPGPATHRAPR